MCAELFRIPVEYRGVPIFGWGLLLVIWLAVGGWAAYQNVRAGGHVGDGWGSLALGAAAIIFLPRLFPDGLPLRSYGLMLLCGSVAGLAMALYRGRQNGIDAEQILSLAMGMFICGIAGARLFYVIEYWETRIRQPSLGATLKEAFSYTEGGLVVYGSLIGATAAFLWFCARRKFPPLALADMIAPSLVAGLAFGRIGCLLNGCCYGGETDVPYAVTFPRWSIAPAGDRPGRISGAYFEQYGGGVYYGFRLGGSQPDGSQVESDPDQAGPAVVTWVEAHSLADEAGLKKGESIVAINGFVPENAAIARALLSEAFRENQLVKLRTSSGKIREVGPGDPPPRSRPVHPTQIYSSINAALLAWLLWAIYPLRRIDGQVTATMLTAYPIARYLLEEIRIDESPVFGTGLSISQNISIGLLALAALLWVYLLRQRTGLYHFTAASTEG